MGKMRKEKLTLREMTNRLRTHGRIYYECTKKHPHKEADYHKDGTIIRRDGDIEFYECPNCGREWSV